MEQIYYTQCPMGYGLGASNGFQIKRKTDNYPVSSDFRHLGLRAYPGGGRVLAPSALRYRRGDDHVEIAYLSPRPSEYETERGLWGRPGGHFAHGILLTPAEFDLIDHWPAGLFGTTFWQRNDPVPTRTQDHQDPHPRNLTHDSLIDPKSLWTSSLSELLKNEDLIARVITALAQAGHGSRTLFVIDEAERLGWLIALLTWVFPRSIRGDLTFSTFHDRPEELPGYRIQGTIAAARPNKGLLLTQGFVLDTKLGTIEPAVEPAPWSRVLAGWLRSESLDKLIAWGNVLDLAGAVAAESHWNLDRFALATAFYQGLDRPANEVDWSELRAVVEWIPEGPLRDTWADTHTPVWWLSAGSHDADGRAALLKQATFKASRKSENAAGWGRVAAKSFEGTTTLERESAVIVFLKATSTETDRVEFLRALRDDISPVDWAAIRKRLETVFPTNSKTLAVLAAAEALTSAASGQLDPLQTLVDRFRRGSDAPVTLLRVIAAEAAQLGHPIEALSESLRPLFDDPAAITWALRQKEPAVWLGATFRRLFALIDSRDEWEHLRASTPNDLKPALARVVLSVTAEEGLANEAFGWAVEHVLMSLPEPARPIDPRWPGLYLDRSKSDVQLITHMLGREHPGPQLRGWFKSARSQGQLDTDHKARLDHVAALAKTLASESPAALDGLDLARIPGVDRGSVLGRWLAQNRPEVESVLDHCGESWFESFQPGSIDLHALAKAIALSPMLRDAVHDPRTWLHRLFEIRRCVQVGMDESSGMDHEGLIAQVVACATDRRPKTSVEWELLGYLLNNPLAWRTIGEAFRLDLDRAEPSSSAEAVEIWDRALTKSHPARFWETILNHCDGRRLSAVVSARASDLVSLEPMSWWAHHQWNDSVNDMRDAFARQVPFAPIAEENLAAVQNWMNGPPNQKRPSGTARPWLSATGQRRWGWIDRLSKQIFRNGESDISRTMSVFNWRTSILKEELSVDDRYRLVAWLIYRIDDGSSFQVEPVALWLVRGEMTNLERITRWYDELTGLVDISDRRIRDRAELAGKLRREMNLVMTERPR